MEIWKSIHGNPENNASGLSNMSIKFDNFLSALFILNKERPTKQAENKELSFENKRIFEILVIDNHFKWV